MIKVVTVTMLLAATIVMWGCSDAPKLEPRTIEAVRSDILAKTDDVNSYLSTHDLVNTKTSVLSKQLQTYSVEYGSLETEAAKMQQNKPDPALDDLLLLASEGAANTSNLSKALEGDPNNNPAAFTALQTAIAGWVAYTDKSIQAATGNAPTATATTPSGTATTPPPTAVATDLPGKGKHYGWWKNPAWANDPASRPNPNPPPGQAKDDEVKGKGKADSDKPRERGKSDEEHGKGSGKGNQGRGGN